MEKGICRVGDSCSGICPGHSPAVPFTAIFNQGTSKYTADGIPVVLVGHTGPASCGHTAIATSGSGVVDVDGVPVVRQGDAVVTDGGGSGTVDGGSPNVKAA